MASIEHRAQMHPAGLFETGPSFPTGISGVRQAKTSRPPSGGPRPGSGSFSAGKVQRAVLAETIQHPLTILPAAVSAVGGLYMGLFGPEPAAFAATFVSAFLAAGVWVFNYFIRGEALAERQVAKLREERAELKRVELRGLEAEWAAAGHEEGERQARELRQAYQKLTAFLEERVRERGSANAERLASLARDTYSEGVSILRQALEAFLALRRVDREKLERELFEWRAELGRLKRTRGSSALDEARATGLDTRIAAHERRLRLWEDQAKSVERLLAESESLEAALESTYLELVDLGNPEALFSRGHAAGELERAVAAARRVDERLRGMSGPSPEDEEVYLAASERQR